MGVIGFIVAAIMWDVITTWKHDLVSRGYERAIETCLQIARRQPADREVLAQLCIATSNTYRQ